MFEEVDFTGLWCDLLFEELYRNGLRDVCLAPGSRSAPLTLAADRHTGLTCRCHYDERGLGFFALGLARAKQQPVIVITTSGTAVANLSPAIHEARETGVPLLILTADRPPELLGCGANQTMNQHGVFGSGPVKTVQLPSPEHSLPARWLLSTVTEAVTALKSPEGGAVHINQALREPLYGNGAMHDQAAWLAPVEKWREGDKPICEWQTFPPAVPHQSVAHHQKIVVIAGVLMPQEGEAVKQLVEYMDCVVLAGIQSGLHGHPKALSCVDLFLGNKAVISELNKATLVIQFGRRFVSKRLGQWLEQFGGEHWYVDPRQDRHDPFSSVTRRISCPVESFCHSLEWEEQGRSWVKNLKDGSRKLADSVAITLHSNEGLTEAWTVNAIKQQLTSQPLFIGNSMPIRLFDALTTEPSNVPAVANRGVSGIDGLVSSAAGHALGFPNQKTVMVIGDLSLLHDLNALALAAKHGLLVVALNNSGGSIFNIFPVKNRETRSQYFQVEHELQFAGAAKMFGMNYQAPETREGFIQRFNEALESATGSLIEVITPPDEATNLFAQLLQQARSEEWL